MPDKKEAPVANGAETKKVLRRGLSTAVGTQSLRFDTRDVIKPYGLFLAHLEKVEVSEFVMGEDKTGMPSFNGYAVPRITFTFASNEDEIAKRRIVRLQFNAVESTALTIPGKSEEWKVNLVFNYLKHILNVFVLKGREMTAEEEEKYNLDFVDFDEQGEYVAIPAETVLRGWKNLFENVAAVLNTGRDGEKPYFKTADNKIIPLWIKLIRYFKARNEWKEVANGALSFPQFVGEGVLEVYQANVPPTIKLDATREWINLRDLKKDSPKAPNMLTPAAPAGGIDISAMTAGMPNIGGPIVGPAEEDLPF